MLPFIFSFFNDFLFYYSFYVSYFVSNGMSADKLAILFVAMNASKMITDIPVGLLSDRISRRNMLIIGILFRCLFCLLCISSNNLIVFILSMVIVGIGNSCLWTHTWNYFYDYLKEKGKQGNFSYFMGKFYAISNTAIALAGFTGPYIYSKFDFNGIFILSIFSMIIAIFVITQMPNYKPKKTIKTAEESLLTATIKATNELTDNQIRELLIQHWIKPIIDEVELLDDKLISELIRKIEYLSSKYEETFVDISNNITRSEKELSVSLSKLTGSEFDMRGVEELRKMLEHKDE